VTFLEEILGLVGKGDEAVKRIVKEGYPEHTARKIESGELPMDEASRMERARQQSFRTAPDQRVYHGTSGDIYEWDESLLGQRDAGDLGPALYTTSSPEMAKTYAAMSSRQTGMPQNLMELMSATDARDIPMSEKMLQRTRVREGDIDSYLNEGENIKFLSELQGKTGTRAMDTFGKEFETANYDLSKVRSSDAAFDPENVNSNYVRGLQGGASSVGGVGTNFIADKFVQEDFGDDTSGTTPDYSSFWDNLKNMSGEAWDSMHWLDKAALVTSPVPVVGTAVGLAADARSAIQEPEEFFTPTNLAITGGSYFPFGRIARYGEKLGIINNRSELPAEKEIDPRFAKTGTGGDPRAGDLERAQATTRDKIESGSQDVPEISIFDQEGKPFVISMSDRTDSGGVITKINNTDLKQIVDALGGQGYMFENPGQVWASDAGPVSRILNLGKQVSKGANGQNPLYLPYRMAPTGGDYSHQTGEAMLAYADSVLGRSDKNLLNKKMKEIAPDWKGINSPKAMQQFRDLPGDDRKKVIQMLDRDFRDIGGLTAGEARVAVSDPAQLAAKEGNLQNVGLIDLARDRLTTSGHPSYAHGVPGEGLGRLKEDIPAHILLPDRVKRRGMVDPANPSQSDMRSLMSGDAGIITNDILKSLEELLRQK
jgi:hypothetical protein